MLVCQEGIVGAHKWLVANDGVKMTRRKTLTETLISFWHDEGAVTNTVGVYGPLLA